MKKGTHQLAGAGLAVTCFMAGMPVGLCCGVFFGSTAPDALEVPTWRDGIRSSLIPHRTVTHWLLLWVVFLVTALILVQTPVIQVLQGYCLGAILHVCMDGVTPMGVPLISLSRTRLPETFSAAIVIVMTACLAAGGGYVGLGID